jgi:hypothetical protein
MHRFAAGQVTIGASLEASDEAVAVDAEDPEATLRAAVARGVTRLALTVSGRVDPHALLSHVAEALGAGELEAVAITAADPALVARLAAAAGEYL